MARFRVADRGARPTSRRQMRPATIKGTRLTTELDKSIGEWRHFALRAGRMTMRGQVGTLLLVLQIGGGAFAGLGLLVACRLERTETMTGVINLGNRSAGPCR
jgi:hypothetical protein